jgi:hypothetical protein
MVGRNSGSWMLPVGPGLSTPPTKPEAAPQALGRLAPGIGLKVFYERACPPQA